MGRAAEQMLLVRQPGQTALQLLDAICEPYRGCDAEFEAEDPKKPGRIHPHYTFYTDPVGPLGLLIAEAFAADRNWADEWRAWRKSDDFGNEGTGNVRDCWEDGCYAPGCPMQKFSQRYDFS